MSAVVLADGYERGGPEGARAGLECMFLGLASGAGAQTIQAAKCISPEGEWSPSINPLPCWNRAKITPAPISAEAIKVFHNRWPSASCYASLHLTERDDIPENLVSKWACVIGYDPLAPNRYTQKSGESPDVIIFDGPAACWGSK
jgi:hypothetical protein